MRNELAVKINGKWTRLKQGKVVAPSDSNLNAKTISGDTITQKLITLTSNSKGYFKDSKGKIHKCLDNKTYTSTGKVFKKRKKSNKANQWQNGLITNNYRIFYNIPKKGMYSKLDLRGIK